MPYYQYPCTKKERGVAIAKLFRCQRTTNSSRRRHMLMWSCQQKRASSHHQLEISQPFSHIECNWICYSCLSDIYLFWITAQVELISLEHCSSRNRKILRHIVHTLKFLAWLLRMNKHKTPKLVAQDGLQKLRSAHDLSKVICVVVSHKRIFNMYWYCRIVS